MMYLRFALSQLKVVGLIILSAIFVYPFFVYPNRVRSWSNRFGSFRTKWYWFAADTEGTGWQGSDYEHYLNATFGLYELIKKRNDLGKWVPDYERFEKMNSVQKFILAYRWSVIRNGCWNYIQSQQPRQGVWENENCKINTGGYSCKTWRNKTKHGTQSITWEVDDIKYFRYSFTKKLYKDYYINFMMGASNNRYLIKLRIFDIKTN